MKLSLLTWLLMSGLYFLAFRYYVGFTDVR
ncbi:hypothetical protein ACVW2L_001427 [Mucilaginibacter sp. HD30]